MINYDFLSCADSDGNIKEINVCPAEIPSSARTTGKVLVWYPDALDDNLFHIIAESDFVKEDSLEMTLKSYVTTSALNVILGSYIDKTTADETYIKRSVANTIHSGYNARIISLENSKPQIIHTTLEMKIKNVSGIDAGIYIHVLSPDGISSSDPTFTEFINWLFPTGSTFTSQSVQASGGIIINGKLACVTNVTFKSDGQILVNYFWDNNGSGGWNSKTASASDLDASSECHLKRRVNIPIAIKK